MYHKIILIVLLLLAVFSVEAQDSSLFFLPPTKPIEFTPTYTEQQLNIDGVLDESVWMESNTYDSFKIVEPTQGEITNFPTFIKILYNDQYLYIGAFCYEPEGKFGVRVTDLQRDFSWKENDLLGVVLDPFNSQQFSTSFQTSPYGSQRDMQVFNAGTFDINYNALWKVRTKMTDSGWTAEFAIPFKSLFYPDPRKRPTEWRINFFRRARKENEVSALPLYPRSLDPYRSAYAGIIRKMHTPVPASNIRIQPYVSYINDKTTENGKEIYSSASPKVGGDIKWTINPQSVLDFTINTDFAQADVDRAVQNLGLFSIFFPERRQFFLENSGLFNLDTEDVLHPFFSRKIGLDEDGNPIPIDVGIRYVSRMSKANIGVLAVSQNKFVQDTGSYMGVFRFQYPYNKQDHIGALITHKTEETHQPNLSINNTTISLTGFNRPNEKLTLNYFITSSIDNTAEQNGKTGWAANFALNYTTNQFGFETKHYYISEQYDPELGFVVGTNLFFHNTSSYLNWRPRWRPSFVRAFLPFFDFSLYQKTTDFSLVQTSVNFSPIHIEFQKGDRLRLGLKPVSQEIIEDDFSILDIDIAKGRYSILRYQMGVFTNPSARVALVLFVELGDYFNGVLNHFFFELKITPIPYIQLQGEVSYNQIRGLGIQKEDKDAYIYTISSRFSLNPRLHLTAFYQYNSESIEQQSRWNVRLAWEYQPLSFLYLVFNQSLGQTETSLFPRTDQNFIGKLSYIKQF